MLLRTPEQMALNQLESLCQKAADHYEAEAGKTDDAELGRLFKDLELRQRKNADALVPHIHALDDLPGSPDPDRETIDELLVNVKMLLSGDPRDILISGRLRAEHEIAEAADRAVKLALPEAARQVLEQIHGDARDAISRLEAAKR